MPHNGISFMVYRNKLAYHLKHNNNYNTFFDVIINLVSVVKMVNMAVFSVTGYLVKERRSWPVI